MGERGLCRGGVGDCADGGAAAGGDGPGGPGGRVLDVAGGSGNASLAAARRGCRVVSTDYVPSLLERGKVRAAAEGYRMEFMEADAENLPFEDGAFDAAVSTVGVMFAPDQMRAAAEIFRVVKAGGVIGLACWTPESFVGRMFGLIGKYQAPAAGVLAPALWGTRERLAELFPTAAGIEATTRIYTFRAPSAEHWLEEFKTYFGPMLRTFAALDEAGRAGLTADLLGLVTELNRSDDRTMVWGQ